MVELKKIYKYRIPVTDETELLLPVSAKILSVKEQGDDIVLYALITPYDDKTLKGRNRVVIRVVGTGRDIRFDTNDFTFLGTVNLLSGRYMFHVFYRELGYTLVK